MLIDVFMRYPGGRDKALTFSYDDGLYQDIRLAEIFDRHHMKCTFNHSSGYYSPENADRTNVKGHCWIKESEAQNLFAHSDHELALHGDTHPFYDLLPEGNVVYDLVQNRISLEKRFQRIVRGFAFPNGSILNSSDNTYDSEMTERLKHCGIAYARVTQSTNNFYLPANWYRWMPTCHHNSPELMPLAQRFCETRVDRIARLFYVWGHSFEFDRNNNWDVIEMLTAFLANRNDIWYATNIEIYEYVHAYRQLVFSMDGARVYNPTAFDIYIMKSGKNYCIHPLETIVFSD